MLWASSLLTISKIYKGKGNELWIVFWEFDTKMDLSVSHGSLLLRLSSHWYCKDKRSQEDEEYCEPPVCLKLKNGHTMKWWARVVSVDSFWKLDYLRIMACCFSASIFAYYLSKNRSAKRHLHVVDLVSAYNILKIRALRSIGCGLFRGAIIRNNLCYSPIACRFSTPSTSIN
jgi:hypothetical protein